MLLGARRTLLSRKASVLPLVPYSGPGNINGAAVAWHGLRGFSSAYAAPGNNPAVDLVDQGGNNPITINVLSNGNIDTASVSAWVASNSVTTILIAKLYDQSGNAHHATQASFVFMPVLVLNAIGARPGMQFTKSIPQQIQTASNITQAQPLTMSFVGGRFSALGTIGQQSPYGGTPQFLFSSGANAIGLYSGGISATATASDNAEHSFQSIFNGASSSIVVDGSSTTINPGTSGLSSELIEFSQTGGNNPFGGHAYEAGIWAGDKSANNAAMNSNQHTYWGF